MFEQDNDMIFRETIVICTGGFDPLHNGHLLYLQDAYSLGDYLIAGLNSDEWLIRKKGYYFLPIYERQRIIQSLKYVDETVTWDDSDNTAIGAIERVKFLYPNSKIIFANGGDRTTDNIPELGIDGVEYIFGVGGTTKENSSRDIIKEYENRRYHRP